MKGPQTVGAVVGENLARLREGRRLTQYELARALHAEGIRWNRNKIAGLEVGKRSSVDFGELLVLAYFFGVPVWEFLAGEGDMMVAGAVAPLPRSLAGDIARGGYYVIEEGSPVQEVYRVGPFSVLSVPDDLGATGREADEALARRLGVEPSVVIAAATRLWGRTLTDERDQRADALGADMPYDERQARRGHITRALAAEIETLLRGEEPGSAIGAIEQGEEGSAEQ